MKTLYAAVGAPVVTAKRIGALVDDYRKDLTGKADEISDKFTTEYDGWAEEGEKIVDRFRTSEGGVDLDQIQGHVVKLRDQLEDMVTTWRTSFREQMGEEAPADEDTKTTKIAVEDADEAVEAVAEEAGAEEAEESVEAAEEAAEDVPVS